jgi:hypothetical protein
MIDENTTFKDACNLVARHLPAGWSIEIQLEKDGGGITLTDSSGEEAEFPSNYESVEEELSDALECEKTVTGNFDTSVQQSDTQS